MKFNLIATKDDQKAFTSCFFYAEGASPRVKRLFGEAFTREKVYPDARKYVEDVITVFAKRSFLQESQIVKLLRTAGQADHAHKMLEKASLRAKVRAKSREKVTDDGVVIWDGFEKGEHQMISLASSDTTVVGAFIAEQFKFATNVLTRSEQIEMAKKSPIETKNKNAVIPPRPDKFDSILASIRMSKELKRLADEQEERRRLGLSTEVEVLEELYD